MFVQVAEGCGSDGHGGNWQRIGSLQSCFVAFVLLGTLVFTGCGGGTGTITTPPPPTYTVGGSVSGLSGTGLVLQNNGGGNLSVNANGTFTFATPVTSGSPYKVAVFTQPSNPSQMCAVTNGSG